MIKRLTDSDDDEEYENDDDDDDDSNDCYHDDCNDDGYGSRTSSLVNVSSFLHSIPIFLAPSIISRYWVPVGSYSEACGSL